MKISEMIELLAKISKEKGDLEIRGWDMYDKGEFDLEEENIKVLEYENEIPYVIMD